MKKTNNRTVDSKDHKLFDMGAKGVKLVVGIGSTLLIKPTFNYLKNNKDKIINVATKFIKK